MSLRSSEGDVGTTQQERLGDILDPEPRQEVPLHDHRLTRALLRDCREHGVEGHQVDVLLRCNHGSASARQVGM